MLFGLLVHSALAGTIMYEDFGETTLSGCNSKWVASCELDTGAFGAPNSLAMAYDTEDPTRIGVYIAGSSSGPPNGVQKLITTAIPQEFTIRASGQTTDQSVEIMVRVIYLDSNGQHIDDSFSVRTVSDGYFQASHAVSAPPPGVAKLIVQFGVKGAGKFFWLNDFEVVDELTEAGSGGGSGGGTTTVTQADCDDQAAACGSETCDAICGSYFCDNCPKDYQVVACTGAPSAGGQYCILTPACSCPYPNAFDQKTVLDFY